MGCQDHQEIHYVWRKYQEVTAENILRMSDHDLVIGVVMFISHV